MQKNIRLTCENVTGHILSKYADEIIKYDIHEYNCVPGFIEQVVKMVTGYAIVRAKWVDTEKYLKQASVLGYPRLRFMGGYTCKR